MKGYVQVLERRGGKIPLIGIFLRVRSVQGLLEGEVGCKKKRQKGIEIIRVGPDIRQCRIIRLDIQLSSKKKPDIRQYPARFSG